MAFRKNKWDPVTHVGMHSQYILGSIKKSNHIKEQEQLNCAKIELVSEYLKVHPNSIQFNRV